MNIFFRLFNLLHSLEKRNALLLLFMILIMAFLETAGLVSILPFLTILSNPDLIETNYFLSNFFSFSKIFGVENQEQFFLFLGILVFIVFIFSLCFKALTTYAMIRFTQMREYSIGKRLIESYLHQPYSWFLNKHSANLGKNILSEVHNVIERGMGPALNLISQSIIVIFILTVLLIVDVVLALTIFFVLGIIYLIIFTLMSSKLKKLGKVNIKANEERFTAVVEAFGATKEVKLGGLEKEYVSRFSTPAIYYGKNTATVGIISQLPRYLIEGMGFGGMLIIILYLISANGSFASIIPILTLYAFAGYRLLPAIQQIYASLTALRFTGPAINILYSDLKKLEGIDTNLIQDNDLSFNKEILLNNLVYNYPNTSEPALKDINLRILVNERVGIVGPTGCGKTTIVDLILGLLEPKEGNLIVDEKIINISNRRKWQSMIGYVPQTIYLADQSISQNIAFGEDIKKINQKEVEAAAKAAKLHDFISNELPMGYSTKVGERGVRLSGGQRQRIGIARALYRQPKLLIMDEATSALDNLTEQAVMDAINNLEKNITVILIAHRLNTVSECDKIFLMDKGKVISSGNFKELISNNKYFKEMVNTK